MLRCLKVLPERGRIAVFNRAYCEELLVVRVHPGCSSARTSRGGG